MADWDVNKASQHRNDNAEAKDYAFKLTGAGFHEMTANMKMLPGKLAPSTTAAHGK